LSLISRPGFFFVLYTQGSVPARIASDGRLKFGSILRLLGLELPVPDCTTLFRRADGLDVPRPRSAAGAGAVHLIVDCTGLEFHGSGEWLREKHGTRTRRSWRKLHIGLDADTGEIVASALTGRMWTMAYRCRRFFNRSPGLSHHSPATACTNTSDVYAAVAARDPDAAVVVHPQRSRARLPRQIRRNATVTCGPLLSMGVSMGRRLRATTSACGWKRPLGDSSR
jgi:hypothetical protein